MGVISKTAKVRLWGKNMKSLFALGYNGEKGDIINVNIEHLNKKSKVLINVQCDYCGCIKTITFEHYNNCKHSNGLYACTHCVGHKVAETNMKRYGVSNITMLQEVRDKIVSTNRERYGVENVFQSEICKEKIRQTIKEKYNADTIMQSTYAKEKMKNTCVQKYGVSNPAKSQEVKDKMALTNIKRYGGIAPANSLEVREKMAQTLHQNGTTPTSKQQLYIFNFYQTINPTIELNYPISYYNADICFLDEKLTVEYDGGFHNGQVKLGQLTQEEFDQKELVRDRVIKSEGYKQMRIISQTDKLPSDAILFQMLDNTRNYFSLYPQHSWIEYNLDLSIVRNAEYKEGISYDYGKLRKIKDSDLLNKVI